MRWSFEAAIKGYPGDLGICGLKKAQTALQPRVQQNFRESVAGFRQPTPHCGLAHCEMRGYFIRRPGVAEIGFNQAADTADRLVFDLCWQVKTVFAQPDQRFEEPVLANCLWQVGIIHGGLDQGEDIARVMCGGGHDLHAVGLGRGGEIAIDGINQIVGETHTQGAVVLSQNRPVDHCDHRPGWEDHQVAFFAQDLALGGCFHMLAAALDKEQKRQAKIQVHKGRGGCLRNWKNGDFAIHGVALNCRRNPFALRLFISDNGSFVEEGAAMPVPGFSGS